jgi:iron complex outermembrane receptor protein
MKNLISVAIIFCCCLFSLVCNAQDFQKKTDIKEINFSEVIVSANPLENIGESSIKPINILKNKEIFHKKKSTLGETLNRELGVNSTFYSAGVSRPVIRGLGGDNIAILQNDVATIDASATSVDHNISIDPTNIDRIEILRGAQALFYGSKAVGGVINVIDNRIPSEKIDEIATGFVETRYNSADNGKTESFKAEGGFNGLNYHVNGFTRDTDNYDIPNFARSKSERIANPIPVTEEREGRVTNSQTNNSGGSFGLSKTYDQGYLGVAYTALNNNYGIASNPDNYGNIRLRSQRTDFAAGLNNISSLIKKAKFKLGISDYNHTEFEGTSPETTFKNNGYDGRIELNHTKIKNLEGAFGYQSQKISASALGNEAFLPKTQTNINSLFIYEELPSNKITYEFGLRSDFQQISSEASEHFGSSSSRDDLTFSGSTGFHFDLNNSYSILTHFTYTEKAPNNQELYANGAHDATNTFEVGDKNLNIQRSQGFDVSINKNSGKFLGAINLFYNRFTNYIALNPTDNFDADSGFQIYNYSGVPADFYGAETSLKTNIFEKNINKLDMELKWDYVQAENRKTNNYLPRISPMRVGSVLTYQISKIGFNFDTYYVFEQSNTAPHESKTGDYFMVDSGLDYLLDNSSTPTSIFIQGTNLLDEEARNHISFTKDKIAMQGRSLMIGLRSNF